jgi:hypothetical protein
MSYQEIMLTTLTWGMPLVLPARRPAPNHGYGLSTAAWPADERTHRGREPKLVRR